MSLASVALAPSSAVGCYRLLGLFLATVTHFESCSSGPGAFDGGRLLYPLGLVFLPHLLTLNHVPVAAAVAVDVGIFGIIREYLGLHVGGLIRPSPAVVRPHEPDHVGRRERQLLQVVTEHQGRCAIGEEQR